MAWISGSPTLTISSDPGGSLENAECKVTCKVRFSNYERHEMKVGLMFSLQCELYGVDPTGETPLHTFHSEYITGTVSQVTSFTFKEVIPFAILDEDKPEEAGTTPEDEIRASLTLTNTFTFVKVCRKSNMIFGFDFG